MYKRLHVRYRLFLSYFGGSSISNIDFRQALRYQVSWKSIHLEPSSMRADRRTDMNLIVAFRNFAEAPKNVWRSSSLVRSCRDDTCENLVHELLIGSWRLLSRYGNCGNKHMGMSCGKPVFVLYEVRKVGQEFLSLRLLRTQRNVCSGKNKHALHYITFRDCFNVFFLVHFPLSLFL
jgi:hypothetical protein